MLEGCTSKFRSIALKIYTHYNSLHPHWQENLWKADLNMRSRKFYENYFSASFSWSIATSSEKMCCPLKERKHIKCVWKLSSEQQADRRKAKKKIRRKFRLISAATMNWAKRPVSAVIPSETTSLLPTLYRSWCRWSMKRKSPLPRLIK